MVTIITGTINGYKTTKMHELYHLNKFGDGFLSIKKMIDDHVHSYNIMKLSTKETRLFIKHEQFFNNDFKIAFKLGPYLFNQEVFIWVHDEINHFIKNNVEPIYLDEIGLLELDNKGFHQTVLALITSNLNCVITVRKNLLKDIINHYNIEAFTLIDTAS
ncbi:MAG: nucleoside-triphosphatase [Candidatus Izemoplasmataceae bacterium]